MEIALLVLWLTILLFGFVVFFGAPYLPTLSRQTHAALDLLDLKPGQTMLELGCGDGAVLVAAARRGLNVVGYELNPILALLCWVRTRRYRKQVRIVWGNFWRATWPPADGIYTFLLDAYMPRLDTKIMQTYSAQKLRLVSYAFKVPKRPIARQVDGLFLYLYP